MEAINHVLVAAPVRIGDVVIENVCGTGVDVVATKNVDAA
jgi:CxxC motif-containing protein